MDKIILLGDIHGQFFPIRNLDQRLKTNNGRGLDYTDIIILLGDVAANYFLNKRDEEFKKVLNIYPCKFFCVRGNHEERPSILAKKNPQQWESKIFFDNYCYVEKRFPNIYYASDSLNTYNINGHRTLVIPGAYSVDKMFRIANKVPWFPNEQLSKDEMELGESIILFNNKYDLVLSHTCPYSYQPTDLFSPIVNQNLVDTAMEKYMDKIEKQITYKYWLFGHFHQFRVYPKYNNKQLIMLYNDKAIELNTLFKTNDVLQSIL